MALNYAKRRKLPQSSCNFVVRSPNSLDTNFKRTGGNNGEWSDPTVQVTADNAPTFFQNNIAFDQVQNLSNNLLPRLESSVIDGRGWEMVKGTGTDRVATQAPRTRAPAHLTPATSFDCLQEGYFVNRVNDWRRATTEQKGSLIGQLAVELEKNKIVEGVRKTMQVCVLTLD